MSMAVLEFSSSALLVAKPAPKAVRAGLFSSMPVLVSDSIWPWRKAFSSSVSLKPTVSQMDFRRASNWKN